MKERDEVREWANRGERKEKRRGLGGGRCFDEVNVFFNHQYKKLAHVLECTSHFSLRQTRSVLLYDEI